MVEAMLRVLAGLLVLLGLAGCAPALSGAEVTLTAMYQANLAAETAAPARASETPAAGHTPTPDDGPELLPAETATVTLRPQPGAETPLPTPTAGSPTSAVSPAATLEPRTAAKYWSGWPVVPPGIAEKMKEIYRRGQALGNDPHAFSTIGDCQSVPNVFMGMYDSDHYVLAENSGSLEETIRQFKGSFGRQSVTTRDGESVASVFSPDWADHALCQAGETPLACEFRIHKPVIVFINLGTNWRGGDPVTHKEYLQQIVDFAEEHGVIPILSSKGDNQEGGQRLNLATAQVAYDNDLPFWNFWRSIRSLPGKGLDDNRAGNYLSTEAWGVRSYTGLQTLDAIWRYLQP